jgi:hypothetical protein
MIHDTQAVRLAQIERLHSFDLRLARIEARLGEPMSQADRLIIEVMEKRAREHWNRRCHSLRRRRRPGSPNLSPEAQAIAGIACKT